MTGTDMTRWADRAQFVSEAATDTRPTVTLLNATPDPLGAIAALTAMYTGRVVRSLADLTDEDRRKAFDDMMKTELSGPLEAVQFHFLVENVSRAFTHQAVRTRQAFYAQESMRFAVVEDWADRVPLPPSIAPGSQQAHDWQNAIDGVASVYESLVNSGVPAEDARGIMPHAITTRLHLVCDLRTLLHQAGLRLCTQAQFEWRVVMAGIVKAIRAYPDPHPDFPATMKAYLKTTVIEQITSENPHETQTRRITSRSSEQWQWRHIAKAMRPVCYQKGACTFMASMDRGCTIRPRVNANAEINRPSSEWDDDWTSPERGTRGNFQDGVQRSTKGHPVNILAVSPAEWALDPGAARANGGGFVG